MGSRSSDQPAAQRAGPGLPVVGFQPEPEPTGFSRWSFSLPDVLFTTRAGTVLGGASSGPTHIDRSTDGGRTWTRTVVDAHARCFFEPDPAVVSTGGAADAVYACGESSSGGPVDAVLRSYADGAAGSWEALGVIGPPGEVAYWIEALAALPPSVSLPDGRLVVGVANGIATSDDGGLTWSVSEMWRPFGWWVYSLAVVADSSHPYGGTVLAGLGDFSRGVNGVWGSEDGGRTWTERVLWPGLSSGDRTLLAVGSGGAVYAATNDIGPRPNLGRVYRTVDGGRTWESISGPESGWGGYGVWVLLVGRDGRLYAATGGGVWRTVDPVAMASDAVPEPVGSLALTVAPNPTGGATTLHLTAGKATDARVAVYDVRGRGVAEVYAGPLAAGLRQWSVETAGWAAGVYVVRVESGGATTTFRFTVAR